MRATWPARRGELSSSQMARAAVPAWAECLSSTRRDRSTSIGCMRSRGRRWWASLPRYRRQRLPNVVLPQPCPRARASHERRSAVSHQGSALKRLLTRLPTGRSSAAARAPFECGRPAHWRECERRRCLSAPHRHGRCGRMGAAGGEAPPIAKGVLMACGLPVPVPSMMCCRRDAEEPRRPRDVTCRSARPAGHALSPGGGGWEGW